MRSFLVLKDARLYLFLKLTVHCYYVETLDYEEIMQ